MSAGSELFQPPYDLSFIPRFLGARAVSAQNNFRNCLRKIAVLLQKLTRIAFLPYAERAMPSVELNDPDAICSANQLAAVVGVSPRQVDVLRAEGVLSCVRSRLRGRRYRLSESVQRFIAHEKQRLAEQSAHRNGSAYDAARTRRMNATALIEEARARQVSGELIDRTSATIAVTNVISAIKNHVLALPNRLSRVLAAQTDASKVHALLKNACRGALQDAHDFCLDSIESESRNGERKTDGS
jgi:phage terminase Nu1 subunit (DNA packaging protein)